MPQQISRNNITVFIDPREGLLSYAYKNRIYPLDIIQGNIFKIRDNDFNGGIINKIPELQFREITTQDGIRTFMYVSTPTRFIAGGGGSTGITGINVQDDGTQLSGKFKTLNFAGAQVTVTDDGNGQATITVGGGGMITGGGTLNRIAMFTAPTVIGDSPFLRSGSDVTADGNLYFASGNGIDVTASGGADVLSIGVTNADIINYGYSGTTHNFSGAVFNESTTNLNVKDKLITINDGGGAGTGGSAGFEIEEAGVATGYFIQNATRNGFDFQASAITGVATFSLALLTANRTATLQDASGTIAYLSDIPVTTGFFAQNGNSFGAPAVLGTNDVFSLSFETSGVTRETISATGLFGINTAPVAGTLVTVQSTGTTSATWIEQWYNSTGAPTPTTLLFGVRDDGFITAGLTAGSMTIGFEAGFTPTIVYNTFVGVRSGLSTATGIENTGFGGLTLRSLTIGERNTAVGYRALTNTTTESANSAFGHNALSMNTVGFSNTAIGTNAMRDNTIGHRNVALGDNCLISNINGIFNTAIGHLSMFSNTGGEENTALGRQSLFTNISGIGNVALGFSAGYYETNSDKLWIDNRTRTNLADGILKALVYGQFSGTDPVSANQFFRHNSNVGINTHDFGTGAPDGVLSILNVTAVPTSSPANQITIYSIDTDDATASLGLRTEQAVVTEAVIADRTLKVTINGTIYKICLKV